MMSKSGEIISTRIPPPQETDDLLWRHLKSVPAFRSLLRAIEARFYKNIDLPQPILDIGCGDGHFSKMVFGEPTSIGVDPWWGPLNKARQANAFKAELQCLGDALPFTDQHFSSIISNSVLEHILDHQAVLREANRVLKPEGRLVITVPSHLFTEWLGGSAFLNKIGAGFLAEGYGSFFNFISRHAHTDSPSEWAKQLANCGFTIERWQYYFSKPALRALEWGHVQGLPSAILHFITGHWIVATWKNNLRRTEQWVRPFYEEEFPKVGAYIFIIARKKTVGPIEADLPVASPFTLTELRGAESEKPVAYSSIHNLDTEIEESHISEFEILTPPSEKTGTADEADVSDISYDTEQNIDPIPVFPIILLTLTFLFAVIGQAILNNKASSSPMAGLRWYGCSIITLFIFTWHQNRLKIPILALGLRLKNISPISRRKRFFFLALILTLIATNIANPGGIQNPILALIFWLIAIITAYYSLSIPALNAAFHFPSKTTTLVTGSIFFLALLLRMINLTGHPFILNGVEASIGLDVIAVRQGLLNNPFGTGFLTNPTLILYLLRIPVGLLGATTLSIRLFSPFVGATSVALTYLFGRRLWGNFVGLSAAVFLAGSHFHLQYSRLGMTNIWDSLFVLLSLGSICIAWNQREKEPNRNLWLGSGLAIGLSAYFFTSSRLLPIMLLGIVIYALLFHTQGFSKQLNHVIAAAALSLVIALPQIIHYANNPDLFSSRLESVGIFDHQSGWLSQEAIRTNQSNGEIVKQQLWQSVLAFNYSNDHSSAYQPNSPLLGFGPAILFVLGIILATLRFRQFNYYLLLIWIIVPIFAVALLIESPSSHRLVITVPALCFLAAIALDDLTKKVTELLPDKVRKDNNFARYYFSTILFIAIIFALNDITFYFGRYQNQHSFGDRNTEIADRMARYLNSLDGDEWTAFFHGSPSMYIDFPTIPFLAKEFRKGQNLYDVIDPNDETHSTIDDTIGKFVHIFVPERANEIKLVQAQYPEGRLSQIAGYFANPLFYIFEYEFEK